MNLKRDEVLCSCNDRCLFSKRVAMSKTMLDRLSLAIYDKLMLIFLDECGEPLYQSCVEVVPNFTCHTLVLSPWLYNFNSLFTSIDIKTIETVASESTLNSILSCSSTSTSSSNLKVKLRFDNDERLDFVDLGSLRNLHCTRDQWTLFRLQVLGRWHCVWIQSCDESLHRIDAESTQCTVVESADRVGASKYEVLPTLSKRLVSSIDAALSLDGDGLPRLIVVDGPPGCGRSALLDWLETSVPRRWPDVTVVRDVRNLCADRCVLLVDDWRGDAASVRVGARRRCVAVACVAVGAARNAMSASAIRCSMAPLDAKLRVRIVSRHWRRVDDDTADAVAHMTAGFVARDLVRLARRAQAAHRQSPSSLVACFAAARRHVSPSHVAAASSSAASLERPRDLARYRDVGGYEHVWRALDEHVRWPLEHADTCERMGLERRGGVLLHGPSGTGKTLIVEAFAASLWPQVNFLRVKAPLLFSQYVGDTEAAIRRIFRMARDAAPVLLFIDEIDAITTRRTHESSDSGVHERVVAQLLNEMDGVDGAAASNVYFVACTSRIDLIDPALLRPGRFTARTLVDLPELGDRKAIIDVLVGQLRVESSTDEQRRALAARMANMSGADIANRFREAALAALHRNIDCNEIPFNLI
jgi:ATPase family associated with various cellular activities (AAA)/AAA+ lid domain